MKDAVQQDIEANFKLTQLPDDLLAELTAFVNDHMGKFRVHRWLQYKNGVASRPKIVWAIGHSEHGGFGLYIWGQMKEDYGRMEEAPEIIVKLIKYMSELYGEEFNHCMLTLHINGTCGIPPHPDKSFSKESKGRNETSSKIADISLGATRAFMLVPNDLKSNDTFETTQPHSVATLKMTHGTSLRMDASWNNLVKHCVPFEPEVTEPRISMVFRRVDKQFIHPTENLVRSFDQDDWHPLLNGEKQEVQLRRQTEE